MTVPLMKSSFASGEIAPSLYGRVDLQKWHTGCSVARNMFISYKGGLASRAGTAFVGACKQPGSAAPPRLIKFKFNLFQSYILELGDHYLRVITGGAYVTEAPFAVTAATQANPGQLTVPGNNFANGDSVALVGLGGMVSINSRTFIATNVGGGGAGTFTLTDIFGQPVRTLALPAYTGGGTAARIYTLPTPWAAVDLPYLKFAQSANVMSLCCVNQQTGTDYPPYDLLRLAGNNWTLTPTTFASIQGAPTATAAVTTGGTGTSTTYSYVVTAVDAATGQESVASTIGSTATAGDIGLSFGTVTVTWAAAAGNVASYNIYKATPSFTAVPISPVGQLFGFVGSTLGALTWQDTNIIPDFATTPPLHRNPFNGTGNYPGVVGYFQQRRVYGATLNAPDTYFMSQPGSYTNMDSADPPIDSDAIIGTPWATQVNAIQWLTPMPGGLIVHTGEDAWQVAGTAGAGSAITPAQQSAQPQESNGTSPLLQPIKVNKDILYGQALGSTVRDMEYNFYANIYSGADATVLSSQLFFGFTLTAWAFAREPYKVVWAVRNDGRMLSWTYLKEQEVNGWTRHSTNGLAVSVAESSEPPVNAVYWIMQRYILGKRQWIYYVERMDNRLWNNVEQCWCVDCGLALPQPAPNATLTASAASGPGGINGANVTLGGTGYSATPAGYVTDVPGGGQGAVVSGFTVVGGVITAVAFSAPGSGYIEPTLVVTDATGSGAIIALTIDNGVTFTSSAPAFVFGDVGSVIRMGGGIATISQVLTGTQVIAQMTALITATVPEDPNKMPIPAAAGTWTKTAPVTNVLGLDHLEGMQVSILADGSVVPRQTVTNGAIILPTPASQVTVGLPFRWQMQSLHADLPGEQIQGKRKKVQDVTVRLANSRGVTMGQDQPIAAATPNQAEIDWTNMLPIPDKTNQITAGSAIPLYTGDKFIQISGDWNMPDGAAAYGMVALQGDDPLPCEVLALIPGVVVGDTNG